MPLNKKGSAEGLEDILTKNNHIQIQNNNKANLNRRDRLLKNDSTEKEKQVSNVRTFSPKLNIEIVGNLMINGITPFGLSSKCKHRFRIKPCGGAISQGLVDHIRLTLRRKPDVIYCNTHWYK